MEHAHTFVDESNRVFSPIPCRNECCLRYKKELMKKSSTEARLEAIDLVVPDKICGIFCSGCMIFFCEKSLWNQKIHNETMLKV